MHVLGRTGSTSSSQHFVNAMSLSTMRHININHALHSPSKEQLTTLLSILGSAPGSAD